MINGITIKGLDKILNSLKDAEEDIIEEVDFELRSAVIDMDQIAKNLAPTNNGDLKKMISFVAKGKLDYEFVSMAYYSAYVEFGTKTYIKVPSGLESYAAQFRNQKRGGLSLLDGIRKWLEKKEGLSGKELERQARWVAYLVAKNGIKPQPFFFPAYFRVRTQLLKRLKQIVSEKRG